MSAVEPFATLIRTRDLAAALGIDITTLCLWTNKDSRFRRCLFKRGFYSIALLRKENIVAPPVPIVEPQQTISYNWTPTSIGATP